LEFFRVVFALAGYPDSCHPNRVQQKDSSSCGYNFDVGHAGCFPYSHYDSPA
jgi:hypothetical protein